MCCFLGHPVDRGPRALLVPPTSRGVKPALTLWFTGMTVGTTFLVLYICIVLPNTQI